MASKDDVMVGGLKVSEVEKEVNKAINRMKRYNEAEDTKQDLLCKIWKERHVFLNFSEIEAKKMINTISKNFLLSRMQKEKRKNKNKNVSQEKSKIEEEYAHKILVCTNSCSSTQEELDKLIMERDSKIHNLDCNEFVVYFPIQEKKGRTQPTIGGFYLEIYRHDKDVPVEDTFSYKELQELLLSYMDSSEDEDVKKYVLFCIESVESNEKEEQPTLINMERKLGLGVNKISKIRNKIRGFLSRKGYDC